MRLYWPWRRRRRRGDDYRPGRVTRALLWCGGVDPGLLASRVETYRGASVGILVLVVGALASVTFTMYVTIITGQFRLWYVAAALFWGAIIFAVDRSILVDPSYGDLSAVEQHADRQPISARVLPDPDATVPLDVAGQARRRPRSLWPVVRLPVYLLRVVVAVTIAVLISEALLLIVFHPEIEEQIRADRLTAYTAAVDHVVAARQDDLNAEQVKLAVAVSARRDELKLKTAEADTAYGRYEREVKGLISGAAGHGPYAARLYAIWRTALDAKNNAQKALNRALADQEKGDRDLQAKQSALADETSVEHRALLADPAIAEADAQRGQPAGWLRQEQAFRDFRAAHPGSTELVVIPWLLRILLLAIDLIPLGMKLLAGASIYGRRLSEQAQRVRYHDRVQLQVDRAAADLNAHRRAFQAQMLTELDNERDRHYRDRRADHLRYEQRHPDDKDGTR
ncbi:DUF4407 domain-containing protein [Catellatospora sp. TT07R-123]|uniref:DUF4407 domain-containing protein n=1 Tax=Catellatospora sp. TT07R-123 TaxID=2733863 RepID=UPI001BB3A1CE|nr:DUF4407 domain-containing protein [Catellatospora sp. TT07R-123]